MVSVSGLLAAQSLLVEDASLSGIHMRCACHGRVSVVVWLHPWMIVNAMQHGVGDRSLWSPHRSREPGSTDEVPSLEDDDDDVT